MSRREPTQLWLPNQVIELCASKFPVEYEITILLLIIVSFIIQRKVLVYFRWAFRTRKPLSEAV